MPLTQHRPPAPGDRHALAHRWAWLGRVRAKVLSLPGGHLSWRIAIAAFGALVLMAGLLLLPLPGPGWLIIFAGLGIWAVEFEWAGRLLGWTRGHVRRWTARLAAQPRPVKAMVGVLGLMLLATLAFASWWLLRQF